MANVVKKTTRCCFSHVTDHDCRDNRGCSVTNEQQ
jgi:hypothetical protein